MTKKKNLPKNTIAKNGSWYVRKSYLFNGNRKQVWRKCEPQTAKQSKIVLTSIEAEIFKCLNQPKPTDPRTFRELAERFTNNELIQPVYSNKRKIAGRISVDRNLTHLKILVAYFGNKPIEEITFGDVNAFKIKRLKTPIRTKSGDRSRAIRSVHYELSTLRQMFTFAIRERWLNRSPFQDGKGLIRPSEDNRRFVTISEDEEIQLLNNIDCERFPYLKIIIICCLDAGFRLGEIINLEWSQVDFATKQIKLKSEQTKTGRSRTLPMSNRIYNVLRDWKAKSKGVRVLNISRIQKSWTNLRNSIDRPDLHIHDLRHVFATRLHKKGVGIATISKLLGHANLSTTQIYINPGEDELFEAISRLN